MKKDRLICYFKKTVTALAVTAFWVIIWHAAAEIVDKSVVLPTPGVTIRTLFGLIGEEGFITTCAMTVLRIVAGFAIGAVIGTLLGVLSYKSRVLHAFLRPIQTVVKSTPVSSFVLLAIFWMGKEILPSFISSLIVIPIIWSTLTASLASTDRNLIEAADIYKVKGIRRIKYIYIPSVGKEYVSTLETGFGLAWKAGVAAEVLCTPENSLGREIYYSKTYIETEKLFAWTVCIIIISLIFEVLLKKAVDIFFEKRRRLK